MAKVIAEERMDVCQADCIAGLGDLLGRCAIQIGADNGFEGDACACNAHGAVCILVQRGHLGNQVLRQSQSLPLLTPSPIAPVRAHYRIG